MRVLIGLLGRNHDDRSAPILRAASVAGAARKKPSSSEKLAQKSDLFTVFTGV